ncbi:hypothetical protein SAMN05444008_1028 [Cnuella takakiae]|uniref:Outer membrane protein beta-barrel domain-containing protein n=1 Tax=Cnuella takakiae TaxID=1302690 RepID=A0A1M4UNR6_9BACT|nr:hypothetical protein [Cnuella takakiae]SHE58334.1 hypothetical protein SAMN05444008_1028 [Cnuella takakiae]
MKPYLLFFFTLFALWSEAQKPFFRDFSVGYRIGEGEAVESNPFFIPPLLKKPAGFQKMLDTLQWNSLHGNSGPVTYHRVFLQAVLGFPQNGGRFWRNSYIPVGINYAFREKRGGMDIGTQEWYARSSVNLLETKKYWMTQSVRFIGLHAGIYRKIRITRKVSLQSGVLLQGEMAINHHFKRGVDTSAFSPAQSTLVYKRSDQLPTLHGRNFGQWSVLIPLSAELNLYKKQWYLQPEITVGLLSNRYLKASGISRESINAALWFIYRRN